MKTSSLSGLLIGIFALAALAACSGSGSNNSNVTQAAQQTSAKLKLKTTLINPLPADTIITGYDVLIELPEGVTVKSTISPPMTDPGVVTATEAQSSVNAVYQPAAGNDPGRVHIIIVSPKANGFDPGTFCEVHGNIAPGYKLWPAKFPQPTFEASFFDVISSSTNTTLVTNQVLSLTSTPVIQ
jgi:hypothetical protein